MAAATGTATRNGTTGAAWGDFDGDGDFDLFVSCQEDCLNKFYRNDGSTFTDIAASAGLLGSIGSTEFGCGWADYDKDGDLDLYIAGSWAGFGGNLYRNEGGGAFTNVTAASGAAPPPGQSVGKLAWADYDRDGLVDLYLANNLAANLLLRNLGDGTFSNVAASAGVLESAGTTAASWGDYDDDGDLDLHIKMYESVDKLYRNQGDGTFVDVSSISNTPGAASGSGGAWGDFDDDGDLDLFVAAFFDYGILYRNDGGGSFSDVTGSAGVDSTWGINGASWVDYDNDGDLDLYLGKVNFPNHLFRNDGAGTFTDVAESTGTQDADGNFRAAAWGDYDRDGDLDVYISNWHTSDNHLLQSDATASTGNHWLHLQLVGTASNRDAIGTRVRAVVAGVSQVREVNTSASGISRSSPEVALGLGATAAVESLSVRWPSGTVWDTTNVAANQVLTIYERTAGVPALDPATRASGLSLRAPFPNPSTGATTIVFELARPEPVQLAVFDAAGRRVRTLRPRREHEAGVHVLAWDGRADGGVALPPGIYHLRLSGERDVVSRPIVQLRRGAGSE